MKVKICGMRRLADIEYVNSNKADYAGFVMAPSKRQIDLETLKELIDNLDKDIIPVGVFVNQPIEFILESVERGLKVIQLHGDETSQYIISLKNEISAKGLTDISIWKAIRVHTEEALLSNAKTREVIESPYVESILLDAFSKDEYGGTGETFNWDVVHAFKRISQKPVFVAGGLTSDNVKFLIEKVDPYGVDVSSGVEIDGFKDEIKICEFVRNAKS